MKDQEKQKRTIRSFVRREGRITRSQQRALDELWPTYGIDYTPTTIDIEKIFGRSAPTILEIGFGNGRSLLEMAKLHPEQDYIGIEVHRPGVGSLLLGIEEEALNNIRIFCHDAVEVMQHCIADASLDTVQIFFSDPWHKKKHHKRRLIQTAFVEHLLTKLKANGKIHLATDWENYAEHMMDVLSNIPALENTAGEGNYTPQPTDRPLTKFEQRGQRLGHGVWDLIFTKV